MIAINIFLAFFGFLGTLSAFGGDTWIKGNHPLIKRITKRGWLSLTCLVLAFGMGIYKEILINKISGEKDQKNEILEQKITSLTDSLTLVRNDLKLASSRIENAGERVQESINQFGEQSIVQIEEAFKLAVDMEKEYEDWVVNLNGRNRIVIPGRKTNPMELYWGDTFEYTFMDNNFKGTISELKTVKLKVLGKTYDLHNGEGSVFKHGNVRIYGNTPKPMVGTIVNPNKLENIKIKIFVRSTDATRGQEEFRKLILSSQFSEIGKRIYKVVNTDILRLRAEPNADSQIRSTFKRGSFIRILQEQNGWYEVTTPKNRQGWIKKEFVTEIK